MKGWEVFEVLFNVLIEALQEQQVLLQEIIIRGTDFGIRVMDVSISCQDIGGTDGEKLGDSELGG
eukprot:30782-Ditylum_brightwellii.AAC.1